MCGADSPAPHMHARDKTVVASWIGKNVCMFDLNLLRVLAAVIEQGTITAAADKLQMSQPAISQSINRLRKVIKDDLFVKDGRGITPTRVALQLYRDTSEHVHQADAAVRGLIAFDPATTTAAFRIALTDIGQQVFLPRLSQVMRSMAPQAQLEVIGPNTESVAAQLESGELDLAILSTELSNEIRSAVLHIGDYLCITRPGLFAPPGPSLQELKSHPRVAVTTFTGHTLMEKYLTPIPPGSIVVNTFAAIPGLLASTDLVGFVPEDLVNTWQDRDNLDIWKIAEVETRTEVRAYFAKSPRSSASAWFVNLVIETLRDPDLSHT